MVESNNQERRAGGFTLIELLVVVMIAALMSGMVIANLGSFVPAARLEGSGKQILMQLDYLRSEARIRGREMSMELDLDRARWRIIYPPDVQLTLDQDPDTLEEWSFDWQYLEDTVVFSGAGDAMNGLVKKGLYRIRFDEYGFSSDQVVALRLENDANKVWSLTLRGLTGATTSELTNDGQDPELIRIGEGAF